MKEQHLFFAPDLLQTSQLPQDEAAHALRVLRRKEGDTIWVSDGKGYFYDCEISFATSGKHPQCQLRILSQNSWIAPWHSEIHIAIAPTKMMERIEWFCEKATEIGVNSISFIDCKNSERHKIKQERLERIVESACKQSHKALLPQLASLCNFKHFIAQDFAGEKFIAHCYAQSDIDAQTSKNFLFDLVKRNTPSLVLIGPEGDFSIDEVRQAQAAGFRSISLGESRLRTETAALVAVQMMHLKKSMQE